MSAVKFDKVDIGIVSFHHMHIRVNNGKHVIHLLEDGTLLYSSCTCGETQTCTHVLQALSGRKETLEEYDLPTQDKLISSLARTPDGRRMLAEAKAHFPFTMGRQRPWRQFKILCKAVVSRLVA